VTVSNDSITPGARAAISELQEFVRQPQVMAALSTAQSEAAARLVREPALRSTFVALEPASIGAAVPAAAATIRVAVSRAGVDTPVERHPNSTQVLLVLQGPVETHVETTTGWRIDRYGEGEGQAVENRWHLVPPGVWHKSNAPGPGDCTVVAFHSARTVRDDFR
jgi:mannose-6-phosphate isomerase-like protein (cupin superfamily)